jgi:hypothetical protein
MNTPSEQEVFIKVDSKKEKPNGVGYITLNQYTWFKPVPLSSLLSQGKERFKMPTDEQIIDIGMLMCVENNEVNKKELANILATCNFILDRLHENGDMMIPSKKERE